MRREAQDGSAVVVIEWVSRGMGIGHPGVGRGGQAIFRTSTHQSARTGRSYERVENGRMDNGGMDVNHGGMVRG